MPEIKDRYQLEPYESIPDVWILDEDFQKMDIIDDYTSLIWSRRYYEVGDFELYVRVTDKNLRLLNVDLSTTARFIMRNDTKEVMRIEKIEISTDAEEGDFITASGRDLRCLLYQRCTMEDIDESNPMDFPDVGGQNEHHGISIVSIIYTMTNYSLINPELSERKINGFRNGTTPYIKNAETQSIHIDAGTNIGEKVEELCNDFKIGWKAERDGSGILFSCYEGKDRTSEVIFSEEFSNLIKFTDTEDLADFYNTMILKNSYTDDEGYEHNDTVMFGDKSGFLRYEKTFNGSQDLDISSKLQLRDLLFMYKLPSSYNVRFFTFDEYQTGAYHVVEGDASTPNPYDIGDEGEERTGYDYMSDDGIVIITAYRLDIDKGLGWNYFWYCTVYFKEYYFRIYSEEWYDELIAMIGDIGTRVTIDGADYYHVTRESDDREVLKIGDGYIADYYWIWNNNKDVGEFNYPWALTIPAEYSSTGESITVTVPENTSVSSQDNLEDSKWDVFRKNLMPFSFDLELSDVFIKDRYMAKAYSMVEEALSTNDFEGEIAPDVNYRYREDYDIGDKIRIKTDIGIQKDVRILEAVETFDSDGYNIEVKFGV